jgi:hypothetical protein
MKKLLGVLTMALAVVGAGASRASAATLTLNDGPDVWTLTVEENCTTCAVTLSVTYDTTSPRIGTTLQSVQWDLTDPNVNPTDIGFITQTGPDTSATWTFSFNNINNAGGNTGCGGGDANAVCGVASGGDGVNGGIIVSAGTYTWTFSSTFADTLTNLNTGNIRAGYNTAAGDLNTIFSPGGGSFEGGEGSNEAEGQGPGPEPASLLLFGLSMGAAGLRMRRRSKA